MVSDFSPDGTVRFSKNVPCMLYILRVMKLLRQWLPARWTMQGTGFARANPHPTSVGWGCSNSFFIFLSFLFSLICRILSQKENRPVSGPAFWSTVSSVCLLLFSFLFFYLISQEDSNFYKLRDELGDFFYYCFEKKFRKSVPFRKYPAY